MNCCHFKANFQTNSRIIPTFGGTENIVPGLGTIAAIGQHYKELAWFSMTVKQSQSGTGWTVVTAPDVDLIKAARDSEKLVVLQVVRLNSDEEDIGDITLIERRPLYFSALWFNYSCQAYALGHGSDLDPVIIIDDGSIKPYPDLPLNPLNIGTTASINSGVTPPSSHLDIDLTPTTIAYTWTYNEDSLIQEDEFIKIEDSGVSSNLNNGTFEVSETLSKNIKALWNHKAGYFVHNNIQIPLVEIRNKSMNVSYPLVFVFEILYGGFCYHLEGSFTNFNFEVGSNTTWTLTRTPFSNNNTFYFETSELDDGYEIVSMPSVKSVYDLYEIGTVIQASLMIDSFTMVLPLIKVSSTPIVNNQGITIGIRPELKFELFANGGFYTLTGYTTILTNGNIQNENWLLELTEASFGSDVNYGNGLAFDSATNTVSVDVATEALEDNTKPITSGAVYTTIGNINALLETI